MNNIDRLKLLTKNNLLSHAYAFVGAKGIGKATLAIAFAGFLICSNKGSNNYCGECLPCRLFLEGTNPDFFIIQSQNSSIGVDEIRKLQQDIVIAPMYSPKKVYLIKDAENMTIQAQNCLLKTLEEPPEYSVIILTASIYEALLETIRSRLVKFQLRPYTYNEIYNILQNKYTGFDISFAAKYANGIIGKAIEIIENKKLLEIREKLIEFLCCSSENIENPFVLSKYFEENKEFIDFIFDVMISLYRDILVYKQVNDASILINYDKKDIILCSLKQLESDKLIQNIEIIENARRSLKQNTGFQLTIEVMLMKLQEE